MSRKIPNKIAKSREKPLTGAFCVEQTKNVCNAKEKLTLYRLVYKSRVSTMAVLLLCISFFAQSAELARADELVHSSESQEVDAIENDSSEESVSQAVQEVEEEALSLNEETESAADSEIIVIGEVPEETEFTEIIDSVEEMPGFDEVEVSIEENIAISEDTSTSEAEAVLVLETEEIETQDDTHDDIYITEENATSSEVVAEVVAVAYSDDAFSFNKEECTELASGSFYCQKPQENELEDALFAAPDAEGDLEIYLVRAGEEVQVTNNTTDDAAPFYDQNSNSLVWHRLVEDRYQIVSYDIEAKEETQLTATAENNMEPNRQGKYTVWQRWVDGGWNIVLYDGEQETQITRTTSHNVAPYIHGSLVVWNRHDQVNSRTIEMYDLATETYVTIDDPEGMSVSNPRMVFVYDSLHPNGDIVTKGYDLLAKKFIDLDTLPRSLPDELPASDTTGETRALIQNKSSGKSELEELTTEGFPVESFAATTTATSSVVSVGFEATSTLTLDLTTATPVTVEPQTTPVIDLVIPPLVAVVSNTNLTEGSDVADLSFEVLPDLDEVVEFVVPE